jgi:hypothetical protein
MSLEEEFNEMARLLGDFICEHPEIRTSKDLEKAYDIDFPAYLRARMAIENERN